MYMYRCMYICVSVCIIFTRSVESSVREWTVTLGSLNERCTRRR